MTSKRSSRTSNARNQDLRETETSTSSNSVETAPIWFQKFAKEIREEIQQLKNCITPAETTTTSFTSAIIPVSGTEENNQLVQTSTRQTFSQTLNELIQQSMTLPEKPKFDGKPRRNPITFLQQLERYGEVLKLTPTQQLELVQDCLKGTAKCWTAIYERHWLTYADFKRDFLNTYWTENRQMEIRRKIEMDTYDAKSGTTMLLHFARYVEMASQLTITYPEELLVHTLIRHYPNHIQSLWAVNSPKTIRETAGLIQAQQEILQQNPAACYSAKAELSLAKPSPTPTVKTALSRTQRKRRRYWQNRHVSRNWGRQFSLPAGNQNSTTE